MLAVTPSRLAIVAVAFSLITFFWTFGLPAHSAQPEVPVIDHYDHKNVHTDPIIPPPAIETHATATGVRPAEPDDHRLNDAAKQDAKSQAAAAPSPATTAVAEFEEDGGRWEDKGKPKEGNAPVAPSTLLTHTIAGPQSAVADNATNEPTAAAALVPSTHAVDKHCQNLAQAEHVMVVLKTSKVAIEKVKVQLRTLLSCVPTFAIFSDHEGEFEGHKVHDALSAVSHKVRTRNGDFREYQIMSADAEHKPEAEKLKELEKWKMLPMVYKAYHMNPDARFVIFIEEETALSWSNLLQWVGRLDYRIPYYSGAPAYISGTQSAQRGSGIMISQGALRRFAKSYDELYTSKWEPATEKECCGDLMLARAMQDAHVELYTSWPLLQAEQPNSLDYTKRVWCAPAISWHGGGTEQLEWHWELEKRWTGAKGWKTPYLFRDAFNDHLVPHIDSQKEDWDSLSNDAKITASAGRQQQIKDETQKNKQKQDDEERRKQEALKEGGTQPEHHDAAKKEDLMAEHKDDILQTAGTHESQPQRREDKKQPPNWDKLAGKYPNAADSPDACRKTCEEVENCIQWRYSKNGDGECHLGKVIRLGGVVGDKQWTSGWMTDRIDKAKREWECKNVEWRFYQ